MQNNLARTKEQSDYLTDSEKKALYELKERITKKYPGSELILYGSKARGDYNEDSDIDVLVILNHEVNSKSEDDIFECEINVIERYPGPVFSLFIKSKKDWENYKGNPFFKENILNEGVYI